MSGMNGVFAKRRARLLAMKAIRDNHIPGDKAITCPKCGQDSDRKSVSAKPPSVICPPKCSYHFPHQRLLSARHDSGPRLLPELF